MALMGGPGLFWFWGGLLRCVVPSRFWAPEESSGPCGEGAEGWRDRRAGHHGLFIEQDASARACHSRTLRIRGRTEALAQPYSDISTALAPPPRCALA